MTLDSHSNRSTTDQIPLWVMSSVALRNMATLRVSEARAALVPVEERFIQLSTEVRHRDWSSKIR